MTNTLKKLQSLPEKKKKIILWSVVIILGLALLTFWFKGFRERVESLDMEGLELPKFNGDI